MSTVKELREKQARIATNARAKFDEIKDDTPAERAAEIEREFDAMMAEHDRIGERIERQEKLEAAEKRANAPDPRRPSGGSVEAAGVDEGDKPDYRTAFYAMLASGGNVSDLPAEHRNILRVGAIAQPEFRAQTAGTTTAGGFTVPTELADIIVRTMKAWGPMYDEDICTVLNTSSGNPIKIPTVDDTAVTAEKKTEAAALTDDGGKDVTFGQKSLDAYVFDTEFVRFSMELAQDSIFNVEQLLGDLLGERLARVANKELTIGDGTGDPNGVVTASSLGKTAAATAAITGDEIIDLLHSVNSAYRRSPKARFMFADTTLAAIRKLKDGQGNYLWQMGDVTTGAPGTLLGYRYSINDDMDALAAAKKVMLFGDFSKYFVRKVGAPVIGVLRERFWPDLGIAGLIRFDGELGDTAAVKHLITAAS
jgi:HK97 family phage major capsid protein